MVIECVTIWQTELTECFGNISYKASVHCYFIWWGAAWSTSIELRLLAKEGNIKALYVCFSVHWFAKNRPMFKLLRKKTSPSCINHHGFVVWQCPWAKPIIFISQCNCSSKITLISADKYKLYANFFKPILPIFLQYIETKFICVLFFINFSTEWKRQIKWHNFLMKSSL